MVFPRITTAVIHEDPLLAAAFEYPAFRVDGMQDTAIPETEHHRARVARAFYHTKVPTHDVARLATFTASGWHIVDVNVTFAIAPRATVDAPRKEDDIIVDTAPEIAAQAPAIAARCFRYSRFHLDPDIPDAIANEVKRAWVANYVTGARGDQLFVAHRGGQALGFLAAMRNGSDVFIELVGVDLPYQRQGIGAALITACMDVYHGCNAVVVGTQAVNTPSIRCYERLGFRLVASSYVLHLHHHRVPVPVAI